MKNFLRILLVSLLMGTFTTLPAHAASKEELQKDSMEAVDRLMKTNPKAAEIAAKSKAVLIFPNIVKAGLIFGGAYGEGILKTAAGVDSYYNSITASFGWQAGAQSYGYVVFLMNDKAIKYLRDTKGWELGVGPSVAMVDDGVAKNLSTTSLKKDAYAFIFDQQGLMASLSLEGTKISRIKEDK